MSVDYENLCLQRSQENKAKLKELFPEGKFVFENPSPTSNQKNASAARSRRRSAEALLPPRQYSTRQSVKRRRLSYGNDDDEYTPESDEESDDEYGNKRRSAIRWPGRLTKQRSFDVGSVHSDDEQGFCSLKFKKKRRSYQTGPRVPFTKRPFDAIKGEDLDAVAMSTSEKRYNKANGTSCHQCRQKTDDLKTVCRSDDCLSVARGQFCGPCLKNRYGEDAKEAIMNPEWVCPPCRGICNCSFCMKKRGRRATGILIHVAKNHGFSDVSSFLGDFKDCPSDSDEE